MTISYLDQSPSKERFPTFLADQVEVGEDSLQRFATHLGYNNTHTVTMWTKGVKKVPLRHIRSIASFFRVSLDDVLALWISQEASVADEPELYDCVRRIVPRFEYLLLDFAREVYLGDDD